MRQSAGPRPVAISGSTRRRRKASLALVVLPLLLLLLTVTAAGLSRRLTPTAAHTPGTSYYVDCVSGADTNPGTSPDQAWASVGGVQAHQFGPGDSVLFKRGCVFDGGLTIDDGGTVGDPVTYGAYGVGAAPTLRNADGGAFANALDVRASHVVVADLLVRDATESGVRIDEQASHDVVRNVEAVAVGIGFSVHGPDNVITHSYAHDLRMVVNTPGGQDDYGAVGFMVSAPRNEISYNRCVNCRASSFDYGIDGGFAEIFNHGDGTSIHHNYAEYSQGFLEVGAQNGGSARGIRVYYNVIRNSSSGLCLHTAGNFAITIDDFRYENNTVVKTWAGGDPIIDCLADPVAGMLLVRNNIFYSNRTIATTDGFMHTNNLYHLTDGAPLGITLGPDELVADPLFVDVAAGNFNLRAGSPAIGRGLSLGYETDFDGRPVPAVAPDLGAYQHTGCTPDPYSSSIATEDSAKR
jgi:hypothetical protein